MPFLVYRPLFIHTQKCRPRKCLYICVYIYIRMLVSFTVLNPFAVTQYNDSLYAAVGRVDMI